MKFANSLREVKVDAAVCRLQRDHYNIGDWTIMTDGYHVWISKQKIGEERTDHVEVPKRIFDQLLARYERPQRLRKS